MDLRGGRVILHHAADVPAVLAVAGNQFRPRFGFGGRFLVHEIQCPGDDAGRLQIAQHAGQFVVQETLTRGERGVDLGEHLGLLGIIGFTAADENETRRAEPVELLMRGKFRPVDAIERTENQIAVRLRVEPGESHACGDDAGNVLLRLELYGPGGVGEPFQRGLRHEPDCPLLGAEQFPDLVHFRGCGIDREAREHIAGCVQLDFPRSRGGWLRAGVGHTP